MECLKFLHTKGCNWDYSAPLTAAAHMHMKYVEYICEADADFVWRAVEEPQDYQLTKVLMNALLLQSERRWEHCRKQTEIALAGSARTHGFSRSGVYSHRTKYRLK